MTELKAYYADQIAAGNTVLGIELGSTRIKAVLNDEKNNPIASGSHDWENRLENGIWTYSLEDIWTGLQDCFRDLVRDVKEQYGVVLTRLGALGISGMMHGYMAFDSQGQLLVPFRTWRNNITGEAARKLSELFQYNIPQRWTAAHLYQAMLNGEEHVKDVSFVTTLPVTFTGVLRGRRCWESGKPPAYFPLTASRRITARIWWKSSTFWQKRWDIPGNSVRSSPG